MKIAFRHRRIMPNLAMKTCFMAQGANKKRQHKNSCHCEEERRGNLDFFQCLTGFTFLFILWCSGCSTIPLGQAIENPEQKTRLLEASAVPEVSKVVYHTIIHWPGRELSLLEVVKTNEGGGLSVAGLSELGNTLYAVKFNHIGEAEILTKNLPLSDTWLIEGLVAELLLPWNGPDDDSELRLHEDGTWRLLQTDDKNRTLYIYSPDGIWTQAIKLSGSRPFSTTTFTTDTPSPPHKMITKNTRYHYTCTRERASVE